MSEQVHPSHSEGLSEKEQQQRAKEIANAEERLKGLYDKRNELNQLASEARSVRDTLNTNRGALAAQVRALKASKDELVQLRREHALVRDRLQAQAKAQIASRNQEREGLHPGLIGELEGRRVELRQLERQQETTSLSIEKERVLLKKIAAVRTDVRRLEEGLTAQTGIRAQIADQDGSIDDLFKSADAEHVQVQQLSTRISELVDHMSAIVDDIKAIAAESDRKHAEALELREKADHYHTKATELRSKVLGIREDARAERQEQKAALEQVRADVAAELEDPDKLEAAHQAALDALLSGKRLEI